jgi:hypothetical protein
MGQSDAKTLGVPCLKHCVNSQTYVIAFSTSVIITFDGVIVFDEDANIGWNINKNLHAMMFNSCSVCVFKCTPM